MPGFQNVWGRQCTSWLFSQCQLPVTAWPDGVWASTSITFSIAARSVIGVRNRTTIGCPIPTVVPLSGVTEKATRLSSGTAATVNVTACVRTRPSASLTVATAR